MSLHLYVIDGMDGAGKATQVQRVLDRRDEIPFKKKDVWGKSFPDYNTPTGHLISAFLNGNIIFRSAINNTGIINIEEEKNDYMHYLEAMSSLYALNRLEWFRDVTSNCNEDRTYLCDRYTTSNLIHNGAKLYQKGFTFPEINSFCDQVMNLEYNICGLPKPEFVIYLRVDPQVAMKNITRRNNTVGAINARDINENLTHLECCHQVASYLATIYDWTVVDCNNGGQMRPIEEITDGIVDIFKAKLSKSQNNSIPELQ